LNLRTVKDVHKALYRELVEWFELPSRIAIGCYRDAFSLLKRGGVILRKVGGLGSRSY